MDIIHSHCQNCFKLNCNYDQCSIVYCNQTGCKFRMHLCKIEDHNLICLKVRVPCINSEFGCGLIILRDDLKKHLAKCPASVVHCSFQYNRWPAHAREGFLSSFPDQFNYKENSKDNLNIALAFHDQEMLGHLYKYKKVTRLFKNNLNREAVPILPNNLSETKFCNSQDDQQLTDVSKDNSTLVKSDSLSKCSSFVSTKSQTESTISDDSNDLPWQRHWSPPGLKKSVCEKLTNVTENKELVNVHSFSDQEQSTNSSSISDDDDRSCKVTKLKKKKKFRNSAKLENLIVDLNIEFYANHQIKPKKMYTFKCGFDFRRSEYPAHYQMVHSDIMGTLNGFMEKRCPNHQYNCPFFIRRLHPVFNGRKTKILFSQLNKAFGHLVEESSNELSNQGYIENQDNDQLGLIDLPIEVINKIIGYLDPFSLNNLSLTNKFLRILCSNHLESKGLVTLIWKRINHSKIKKNNVEKMDAKWIVVGYQWSFSNSFDLIEKWVFDNDDKLLNHLPNCKYFDRVIREKPFRLIGLASRN